MKILPSSPLTFNPRFKKFTHNPKPKKLKSNLNRSPFCLNEKRRQKGKKTWSRKSASVSTWMARLCTWTCDMEQEQQSGESTCTWWSDGVQIRTVLAKLTVSYGVNSEVPLNKYGHNFCMWSWKNVKLLSCKENHPKEVCFQIKFQVWPNISLKYFIYMKTL